MTRVTRRIVLLTACAITFAGLWMGPAYAQTFRPQPYLVYDVPQEMLPAVVLVDLEDQFIVEQDAPVMDRWYFMNPVTKTPVEPPGQDEPITDQTLHYRWHTINIPVTGTNTVRVTNQFADHAPWTIENAPRFLLAPTSKVMFPGEPGPPPDTGHHYNCYQVVEAPPADADVDLIDQFGSHGPTPVTIARYLCAPTVKTRDLVIFPILQATDGRDHLACYEVQRHTHTEVVNTRSQFTDLEPDLTQIIEDRFLCVPSKKTRLFDPQPYIVYDVQQELFEVPPSVDLEDQFITEQNVPVMDRWYLMNPVNKTPVSPDGYTEPITDPALHYRWHTIVVDDPGILRKVMVSNQFGNMVFWTITGVPRFLLAPASKLEDQGEPGPPPDTGHHYDCYEAVDAPAPAASVMLDDQFGQHGPLDVAIPRYLCAPVVKTKDQLVFPIFEAPDGRDHLACYEIPLEPHTELVSTRDQFDDIDPSVITSEDDRLLCVPSRKTFPAVPSLAPWGGVALGLLMLLTLAWVVHRRMRVSETA